MTGRDREDRRAVGTAREDGTGEGDRARSLRYGLEGAIDGELPPETIARMVRHAQDCPECADEIERLRRMKDLVRRSCADTAPRSLRDRIAVECRTVRVTVTEEVSADGTSVTVTRTESRTRGTGSLEGP